MKTLIHVLIGAFAVVGLIYTVSESIDYFYSLHERKLKENTPWIWEENANEFRVIYKGNEVERITCKTPMILHK